ncbi:uncharacterized protein LOC110246889 [Exaiptasia diaphana]|uniref:C2H2-type domain-containing protein n=1 Tax=Exaiptasia diaphana TaxID=2652724 RepID=A0A913XSA5_EXADI|nr:uncharacterized protein LOC110246889 [Exaiptasia diaphana]KXJ09551.1 hypothetical protein AC249_AIPGENE24003 [Exaiptasia diaphana]
MADESEDFDSDESFCLELELDEDDENCSDIDEEWDSLDFEEVEEAETHDKPFACDFCSKRFVTRGWLTRHLSLKHNQQAQTSTTELETGETEQNNNSHRNKIAYANGRVARYSIVEAKEDSTELLKSVLCKAQEYGPFKLKSQRKEPSNGNKANELARNISKSFDESAEKFAKKAVETLWSAVIAGDKCKVISSAFEAVNTTFHNVRSSNMCIELWKTLLNDMNLGSGSNILCQFIYDGIFKELLNRRESSIWNSEQQATKENTYELDHLEENALHYVAGYIPLAIKRDVNKFHPSNTSHVIHVIDKWIISSDKKGNCPSSYLDYTTKWIKAVDRGGLTQVNHNFYLFVRRIEGVFRQYLNNSFLISYNGGSIKVIIINELLSSKSLITTWGQIVGSINEGLSYKLFKHIVTLYVDIRARAFVEAWLQKMRHNKKQQVSKKGEHGLRKELQKSGSAGRTQ